MISSALVILLDCHQTSIFAGSSTMRLGGNAVVVGNGNEIVFDLFKHGLVTCALVLWSEWMHVGEAIPGNWDHGDGRVELHRAGTKRDHGVTESNIFVGKSLNISHHVGLRELHSEDVLIHVFVGSSEVVLDWDVLAALVLLHSVQLVVVSFLH